MMTTDTNRRTFLSASLATMTAVIVSPGFGYSIRPVEPEEAKFLQAIRDGDIEFVRRTLDQTPARLQARDDRMRSAFAIATLHQQASIATLLLERGYEPDLHEAALALDWKRFEALAAGDESRVNASHPIGGSAMYCAALGGAGSNIWRVYSQCGSVNTTRQPTQQSALRIALDYHDLEIAEASAAMLLANGAEPNATEPDDDTSLHAAARRGSAELVEMLIRKGARVYKANRHNDQPIDIARRNKHTSVVTLLEQHERIPRDHNSSRYAFDVIGASYKAIDIDDIPLIDRSKFVGIAHGNLDGVASALKNDARLAQAMATTTEGAIEAAAHMGRTDIADVLLENGAPYSLPTAVMRNDLGRVKALLREDPKRINERGAHDFPLLWYPIIGRASIEMMQHLLGAGAQIEYQHHRGTTALHYAALGKNSDLVTLLLDHGADPNRPGRKFGGQPQTPLQLAQQRQNDNIVALLKDHGATD